MKPIDIKVGQLAKCSWGYVTVMHFHAPAMIGCVIVTPFTPAKRFQQGDYIYLRGLDLAETEIIAESYI